MRALAPHVPALLRAAAGAGAGSAGPCAGGGPPAGSRLGSNGGGDGGIDGEDDSGGPGSGDASFPGLFALLQERGAIPDLLQPPDVVEALARLDFGGRAEVRARASGPGHSAP
jgi:hypothetical protein